MSVRNIFVLSRGMRAGRLYTPLLRNLQMSCQPLPSLNLAKTTSLAVRNFSVEARNIQEEIGAIVKKEKVVVFMKGVPDAPRCGFSNAIVQIMRMHDVKYDAHDVLVDEELRQGIKDFSNWPTIPQVYIEGEFVGGCDIVLQMHQNGELVEELTKVGIKSALLPAEDKKE